MLGQSLPWDLRPCRLYDLYIRGVSEGRSGHGGEGGEGGLEQVQHEDNHRQEEEE